MSGPKYPDLRGDMDFSIAASATSNVCSVTITPQDGDGQTIAEVLAFFVWLSDAATGAVLTTTSASGTVTANASGGDDLGPVTAKKCYLAQTKTDGSHIMDITDTSKTAFYVCAKHPTNGRTYVSRVLATADYGS